MDPKFRSKSGSRNIFYAVRQQQWSMWTHRDKTLHQSLQKLTIKATNAGISPYIIDEAHELFKVGIVEQLLRGDNRNGLIAASVYTACRNNEVPRSLNEIEKMFGLDRGVITDANKILSRRFQTVTTIEPKHFIMRFCSKLKMDLDKIEICKFILEKIEEHNVVSGNAPDSIATGAIYLVNLIYDMGMTRQEIGEYCGPSEITINKCYKQMTKYMEYILPSEVYTYHTSKQKKKKRQRKTNVTNKEQIVE